MSIIKLNFYLLALLVLNFLPNSLRFAQTMEKIVYLRNVTHFDQTKSDTKFLIKNYSIENRNSGDLDKRPNYQPIYKSNQLSLGNHSKVAFNLSRHLDRTIIVLSMNFRSLYSKSDDGCKTTKLELDKLSDKAQLNLMSHIEHYIIQFRNVSFFNCFFL